MFEIKYGGKKGKKIKFSINESLVAVRSKRSIPLKRVELSPEGRKTLHPLEKIGSFEDAGVEILKGSKKQAETARTVLKGESNLRYAGRVLCDANTKEPVAYTENFFIKFQNNTDAKTVEKIFKKYKLKIKKKITYASNSYFVAAKEGTGLKVFDIASELLENKWVELCHPEMVRKRSTKSAFPQQWHLHATRVNGRSVNAHANVVSAWDIAEGEDTVIAVIDDGMDMEHEEFTGSGKIIAPRDVTRGSNDPRPGGRDNHGTACSGVACASGRLGASGVAPKARLMPIRLASNLGSQAEADAFEWAANNGADVISCSWGPNDGNWTIPGDPAHNHVVLLPDSTKLAIDFAINNGRNGKGCVITWAAGNGNESVENDGYAAYEKVIAVAACNDTGTKSAYSDFGESIWCCFPSGNGIPSKTPGIWTTDRSGVSGYNEGELAEGDLAGNYTNSFTGTSSACPGAAGVAALVISQNPLLRWDEVKEILKLCCDRIDTPNGNYDADGHSDLYGYGRLNARKAVDLAVPPQANRKTLHTVFQDTPIKDLQTSQLSISIAEDDTITDCKIHVDISHTYIGDLNVKIISPQGNAITLHDNAGGSLDDIKAIYDTLTTSALTDLIGASPKGEWTLEVEDRANADTGKLNSFSLELSF